jgi:hypothetical protein
MPAVAVAITDPTNTFEPTREGVIVNMPRVGFNFDICVGHDTYFTIEKVKGWLREVGSDEVIIFDGTNHKFKIKVIASSDDFIL